MKRENGRSDELEKTSGGRRGSRRTARCDGRRKNSVFERKNGEIKWREEISGRVGKGTLRRWCTEKLFVSGMNEAKTLWKALSLGYFHAVHGGRSL